MVVREFEAQKFDSNVQVVKNRVLSLVARALWEDKQVFAMFDEIADQVRKPGEPMTSCCVYKDRAKIAERVKVAMGLRNDEEGVIQVLGLICDECPEAGHTVTDLCRGCLAHACKNACKLGAIYDENGHAKIDKTKCVECGQCAKACPYTAITNFIRPCERACKAKAISMNTKGSYETVIDYKKCTDCGQCMLSCPFGALVDKSYIADAIEMLKGAKAGKFKLAAVVAPAVAAQFIPVPLENVIGAIKELGFTEVYEAALGADLVAYSEARELAEKGKLLTSCCPGFVSYVEKKYPALAPLISHNLSPMAEMGKLLKEQDPNTKVIFIGPCTAKKAEMKRERVSPFIDCVLTFEELLALLDSRDIDMDFAEPAEFDQATAFGREFAMSGGVAAAAVRALDEAGSAFEVNPLCVSGLDKIKPALMKLSKDLLKENFVEGMACTDGCIGGAGCIKHSMKQPNEIHKYAEAASNESITYVHAKWSK